MDSKQDNGEHLQVSKETIDSNIKNGRRMSRAKRSLMRVTPKKAPAKLKTCKSVSSNASTNIIRDLSQKTLTQRKHLKPLLNTVVCHV
jgi:hypothetical protein